MDQVTRNYVEQSLNIKLLDETGKGFFFNGSLNEAVVAELVDNKFTAVEWLKPGSPDCGKGNGWLYVYLPPAECAELIVCIDVAGGIIYVS